MFSDVFKGYKNVTLDINGLTPLTENSTKGTLTSNYHLVFTTPGVTRNKALWLLKSTYLIMHVSFIEEKYLYWKLP